MHAVNHINVKMCVEHSFVPRLVKDSIDCKGMSCVSGLRPTR